MLQTSKKHAWMLKRTGLVLLMGLMLLVVCRTEAWAAKYSISIAKTAGPPAVILTMGNAVAGTILSYDVKNLGTAGSVYKIAFTVPSGYTLDATQTGDAPANWNGTLSNGNRTMTFATTQNGGSTIPRNATDTFILRLSSAAVPALNQDGTVALSSVVATYNNNKTTSLNNPGASTWSVRSLAITGLTAVDSVTGLQSTTPGGSIIVTLTVTNRSTANWTGVISIPQPPTATAVWNTGSTTVTTTSSPSITLNAGQTGNLVWTYTVGSSCGVPNPPSGSVTFSLTGARNSTNVATSVTTAVASNSVAIGCFTGTIAINPTCLANNTNTTVTMTLQNRFASNINNVNAPANPGSSGTATRTYVSGPVPPSPIASIASGGTATVTWVFTITGTPGQTYSFSGGAVTGTLQSPVKPVTASITPSFAGIILTPPFFPVPIATIASDKNKMVDISWNFTNNLCNSVTQVAITVPAGWTYLDGSALITNPSGAYDDWSVAAVGSVVTFTAGPTNMTNDVGSGPGSGSFILFFSQTPTAQASYWFPVVVTDAVLGPLAPVNTRVDVGPAGGSGMSPAGLWGEQVR